MNRLHRICKCHWAGDAYEHWAQPADGRTPFAPPGTPPQFAPDTPFVSDALRLELHLDVEHQRAHGTTTHTCRTLAKELREIRFHARGLDIARVTVDTHGAHFDNTGEQLVIRLPKPHKQGDLFRVVITHSVNRPPAGLYFTTPDKAYPKRFHTVWSQGQDEDSRYYFPCLDQPNYKQKTEALLYVPKGWFALSNGELVKHQPGVSRTEDLWHYALEVPYSTYLFSTVAGDFVAHTERWEDIEVRWYVQRGREKEGRNSFRRTADMVRCFSQFTGVRYPYKQYSQIAVPDFVFGGMENFTVTTQTDLTLHDDRAHQDFSSDDLVAHELAHSWFGDLVTCRSWAHAWLNESFATYFEAVYKREADGQDEFDYHLLQDAEAYFGEDRRYRRPIVTNRYEAPIDLFDAHLYPGGAVRLRHLHALLGDATFRAALKRYLEAHRWSVAETVDLARAVHAVAGENYDWWFHQWIHSGGYPSLEVGYAWKEEEKVAEVTVKQTQRLDDGATEEKHRPFFRIPTKVAFVVNGRRVTFPMRVEGEETKTLFRLDAKPSQVLFDPDYECPVKAVKFTKSQDLLLTQLTDAANVVQRIEAANTLAEKPNLRAIDALAKQLQREKFWGVQARIARALGKIGGDAARSALIEGLKLRHPKARRAVVEALGHFKDDAAAAAALSRAVRQGDASYYVESELARAVGRSRAPGARGMLERLLGKTSHMDVIRQGVYDGLTELADPAGFPLVEKGARYGAPALARQAALRCAGELGKRHPVLRKRVLDLLGAVAEQRDNPSATFRGKMAALRALENLGDLDALAILRRVQDREVDGRIVRLARTVANGLRQGATRPQEMITLRGDVDLVVKENKALRDRLDVMEQKAEPKPAQETSSAAAQAGAAPKATPRPSPTPSAARSRPAAAPRRVAASKRMSASKAVSKAATRAPSRKAAARPALRRLAAHRSAAGTSQARKRIRR
jgi:aminopeptidase N